MKTTIEIPEPLYKKVKIEAIERGTSLKTVVLAALEDHFQFPSKKPLPFQSFHQRRILTSDFQKLAETNAFSEGTDSTQIISEERDAR
jgi:hypothetical protein